MITDKLNRFADAEATGNTGTRVIGDVIDLEIVRDMGAGKPVYLNVTVDTAITAGAGGTYQIALTSGTDASLSSPVNHVLSAELDAASGIAAGTVILNVALPMEGTEYKRYIGLREIVGTANTTAGAIDGFLTVDGRSYKSYADAAN